MRLIRGAAGSGKTSLVFREFKEALRRNRASALLVVPTATLARHFQHEMARDGEVIPPGSIVTLDHFVHRSVPHLKRAPAGLLRLAVRDALTRVKISQFGEAAETRGMTATIIETIALFENAGATPDQLARVRALGPEAKAFEKIWRETRTLIERRGFSTKTEIYRAAAQTAFPAHVWMDGFVVFTPLERELIRSMSAATDLTITGDTGEAGDDFRRFALQIGAQERLLSAPARKPAVTVVEALSVEREADEIARRILDLRRDGVPFRSMAIAVRNPETYIPLLRTVLERFGTPARFYFSFPLREQGGDRFLSGLVECVICGWEFGRALETLGAHPRVGQSAAFDSFDFRVREAMPGRGAEALAALSDDKLLGDLKECFALDSWRDDLLKPDQWKRRFVEMAGRLYRPRLSESAPDFAALQSARALASIPQAWTQAVECASAFLDPEERVSLASFHAATAEAMDAISIPVSDDRAEAVHVMSAAEARQWDVSALFVCGLTDRDFPRRNPQNLLFPDSDLDALGRAGIPLRKTADLDREEIWLFESLKTRARDSLILTWAAHDQAGRRAESSRLLGPLDATHLNAWLCKPAARMETPTIGTAGRIDSAPLLAAITAQHKTIGVTALEDLTLCRFRFFAGRTLGLKGRPERPQERLSPRATGLIMHEALQVWLDSKREGSFVEAYERAFDEACRKRHFPPGYRMESERIAWRAVARGVSAREHWNPEFSDTEVELSLELPGGVTVQCRVDRIDLMGDGNCIIVDYKSSPSGTVKGLVNSPFRLQGPFYALAAREQKQLNTLAMMYVAVRDGKSFGWGEAPGVQLEPMPDRWMEDARDRAVERLTEFVNGAIHAEPADPERCRWCDFAHTCRFGAEAGRTEAAGA